jgi:hypothetical protein
VAVSLITAAVPGPTVFLEQWGCVVDGVGTDDAILADGEQEEEGEEEASLDNTVSAEDLATKFREGYEMSLNLLWAKIKLPAYLNMNVEAQKSEEEARQILGQLRGFFV